MSTSRVLPMVQKKLRIEHRLAGKELCALGQEFGRVKAKLEQETKALSALRHSLDTAKQGALVAVLASKQVQAKQSVGIQKTRLDLVSLHRAGAEKQLRTIDKKQDYVDSSLRIEVRQREEAKEDIRQEETAETFMMHHAPWVATEQQGVSAAVPTSTPTRSSVQFEQVLPHAVEARFLGSDQKEVAVYAAQLSSGTVAVSLACNAQESFTRLKQHRRQLESDLEAVGVGVESLTVKQEQLSNV
jgi:hypothetical protein